MRFNGFRFWNLNLIYFFGFIDSEEFALTYEYKKREAKYWFWKSNNYGEQPFFLKFFGWEVGRCFFEDGFIG